MLDDADQPVLVKHYFVDEAGDPVLFNRKEQVVVGNEGCSQFFILGFLDVADPESLAKEIALLRKELLSDPYFKQVPSMQPRRRRTATAFHAKDDIPEVRREVFELLMRHEMRFYAEVQDKLALVRWVHNTNRTSSRYHYRPNSMYDALVSRLFKTHLHKDEAYRICFAKRAKSDRTKALGEAIQKARQNFRAQWGIQGQGMIEVTVSTPPRSVGLQAADYFLWALQRCYERREDRYLAYVWEKVALVHDIEDRRRRTTGAYYTRDDPLTPERLPPKRKKEGREI